jgi:membrane protease YdiL (CAAX protease family)
MFDLELVPALPVSAIVVTFCPMIAASILVSRENKTAGMAELLKRAFDLKRIKAKVWYVPVILLMPVIMTVEFFVLRLMGLPIPAQQFAILTPLVMFLTFFIASLGEELGWMGYAIDPMQGRSGALQASLLLGLVWAAWHLIPLVQEGHSLEWIAWWTLATVAQRVIIVWLYNNTGKSVFVAAAYHAMMNLTGQLFPVQGSYYDPRITGILITLVAVIVTVVWGSKTLARYRYANQMQ